MARHLSLTQLTLLLGGILLIGALFILLIYAVHKLFQRQRQRAEPKPAGQRPQDEAAVMISALQGVIARMKAEEKRLLEMLQEAEQRADSSARTLEAIFREIPAGLMVFNREGFLTLSNPAARALLEIDVWSRRRYPEILGAESTLADFIRNCLESGRSYKGELLEHRTPRGPARLLEVSLSPTFDRGGRIDGVLCLVTRRAEDPYWTT